MRLAIIVAAMVLFGSSSYAITYTLKNGTNTQNTYTYSGWVMAKIWTQGQLRKNEQAAVLPGGTITGHTSGSWVGAQAQKSTSFTDQAGTTTCASSVTPEASKTSSLTAPEYEARIDWELDVSVANVPGGNHQAIAKAWGLAKAENVMGIDPNIHPGVTGKIISWNYVFDADWSINNDHTILDNADPWFYAECGESDISMKWDEFNTRWYIYGTIEDSEGDPTSVSTYDYGIDASVVAGITQYCPVGYQDNVSTSTVIPFKVVCGNEAQPSWYWLSTDVTGGGTGGNPIVAGTDLILYAYATFNVHD